MQLNDKRWKAFRIEDLFIVDKGMYLSKKEITKGNIPYITATSTNNGISNFIGNKILFPKNTITIEKISLSAYYQPYNYYSSHDTSTIQNENLDKYVSLFITTMIKRQGIKYSYGRQAQMKVVKREMIYLPIDSEERPDWDFMREYINSAYLNKQEKYREYVKKIKNKLEKKKIECLNSKNWKEFFVTDLFSDIQRGKRLTKAKQIKGITPYISSTGLNNGVDNYISNDKNVRNFSNCLTIANSGTVGSCFYQPFEFIASDHVTHLKNDKMNEYVYLFISTMLSRLSEKYNFNREINDKRISREKIILPVDSQGNPDYIYMEQYIKNIMIKKYNLYLNKDRD